MGVPDLHVFEPGERANPKSWDVVPSPTPSSRRTVSQASHHRSGAGGGGLEVSAATTTASEDYRDAVRSNGGSYYDDEDGYDVTDDEDNDAMEPMIQCGKCTLVNDAKLRVCEACGASLHIAPISDLEQGQSKSRKKSGSSKNNCRF